MQTLRAFLDLAFGDDEEDRFRDEDWQHTVGGVHVLAQDDGRLVGHAAVVERRIEIGGVALRTGYVEAVAVAPDRRGEGIGSRVMDDVAEIIRAEFELGMLGTGVQPFYERLGWRIWGGPSAVRTDHGLEPSPDEDGYLMVLDTPTTPALDPKALITCDWRPGDSW